MVPRRLDMDYFASLGARTQTLWARHDFDERYFAEVAEAALLAAPPAEHLEPIALLAEFLRHPAPPHQPSSDFGQPPVVVFRHRRFYIEVLYWMEGTTALHQHSFSGAFHVLAGSSLQGLYQFEPQMRVSSRLLLGPTRCLGTELLRRGSTRQIRPGAQFIHSLFHLQQPSVTVVVRTQREADHLPQYAYLRPWVAYDDAGLQQDDLLARSGQVMSLLGRIDPGAADAVLHAWLRSQDLTSIFAMLLRVAGSDVDLFDRLREQDDLLAACEAQHPGFDKVFEACAELQWQANITSRRADVTDPDHRYLLALLLNVPQRRDILRLAGEWSGADPVETILRWTQQLTHVTSPRTLDLLGIELETPDDDFAGRLDVVLQTTLRALVEGHPEHIRPRLCQQFPAPAVARQEGSLEALEAVLSTSFLRPVVRAG